MPETSSRWRHLARWLCLALFVATVILLAPGRYGSDEVDMLQQAVTGVYHDWHSPLIAWLWHVGLNLRAGGLSIHVLGVGLFFFGIYLIAVGALARGFAVVGWAVIALSVFPLTWIALATAGNKDVFMSGLMLTGAGLLVHFGGPPWRRWSVAGGLILVVCLAMEVRHNALFAAFPLLACLLALAFGDRLRHRSAAIAAATVVGGLAALALFAASELVARKALSVRPSNVIASLYIFDLAGISAQAKVDAADGFLGADFQARLPDCYDPLLFDRYANWGTCGDVWVRLFGDGEEGLLDKPGDAATRARLAQIWLAAILAHPLAYAAHRIDHFSRTMGLGDRPGWQMSPIDLESFARNEEATDLSPTLAAMNDASIALAAVPFLQPYVWLLLGAAGLLALLFMRPSVPALIAAAFLASGLSYGAGYLLIGVSYALRYSHWTILAVAIGLFWLAAAAFAQSSPRRQAAPAASEAAAS